MSATGMHQSLQAMTSRFHITLAILTLFVLPFSSADCECGYSSTINSTTYTFTDIIESDFLHIANISLDTDWRRQAYNVTAVDARGPFGESSELRNVLSNPLLNNQSFAGPSQRGGDAGLQLYVRGGIPVDGLIPVAEVDSVRTDMLWGSYRAAIKLTNIPGTCGAFFWVGVLPLLAGGLGPDPASSLPVLSLTAASYSTSMTAKKSTWSFFLPSSALRIDRSLSTSYSSRLNQPHKASMPRAQAIMSLQIFHSIRVLDSMNTVSTLSPAVLHSMLMVKSLPP